MYTIIIYFFLNLIQMELKNEFSSSTLARLTSATSRPFLRTADLILKKQRNLQDELLFFEN